jgi:hypothetical protein
MPPKQALSQVIVDALNSPGNATTITMQNTAAHSWQPFSTVTGLRLATMDRKLQLEFKLRGCKPPQQHYKCCLLASVSIELKSKGPDALLVCPICTPKATLDELGIDRPAARHVHLLQWLATEMPMARYYLEHAVHGYTMWHGLVDVYFPEHSLCLQWDGEQHFDGHNGMYDEDDGQQQARDLSFNVAAWRVGCRVVRLHCEDGRAVVRATLIWCARHPQHPVLMLSYKYTLYLRFSIDCGGLHMLTSGTWVEGGRQIHNPSHRGLVPSRPNGVVA